MARTTIDEHCAAGNVQFRRRAAYAEPGGRGCAERVPRSGWRYRHQYVPNHQFRGEGAEREKRFLSVGDVASAVARGCAEGRAGQFRRHSLAQILRGFASALDGAEEIDCALFIKTLRAGADTAYKAVMKPKEGTILTVARVMAEDMERTARQ